MQKTERKLKALIFVLQRAAAQKKTRSIGASRRSLAASYEVKQHHKLHLATHKHQNTHRDLGIGTTAAFHAAVVTNYLLINVLYFSRAWDQSASVLSFQLIV